MSAWHLQMVTVHGVVVVVVKYVEFSLYVPPHAAGETGVQVYDGWLDCPI